MQKMNNYSLYSNWKYIYGELMKFSPKGVAVSFIEIPAKLMVSLVMIYTPKIILDAIQKPATIQEFTMTIAVVTMILAVSFLLELYSRNTAAYCANAFIFTHMRSLWLNKTADMDYEAFVSEEGKQKAEKAREAIVGETRQGIGTYFPRFVMLLINLVGFISYGAIVMTLHPLTVPILLIFYILNLTGALQLEKKKQKSKDAIARANRKLNYIAYRTRGLEIGKDIRLYSMINWIRDKANGAKEEKIRTETKIANSQFFLNILNMVLVFIRDGGAYTYLIYRILKGNITIGDFTLYFAAITGLGDWFSKMAASIGELAEANNYVMDFRSYIDIPDHLNREKKVDIPKTEEAVEIELENVSYSYNMKGGYVLKDINLHIGAGEKIAIVGANGAGKTTIVKLICGLIQPTEGRVMVNGTAISQFARDDYYKLFSAVFQDSGVLPVSIADNIALNVGEKKDYDRIEECILLAGLADKIHSLSQGLETHLIRHISEDATEFSGGEIQKLLLARALYKKAPIIILDEPTAALDPIAESRMYQSYNELTQNRTALFISHRLSSTRFCDRIILLSDKGIAEIGTHEELMEQNGKYAAMFRIQSQYYTKEQEGN